MGWPAVITGGASIIGGLIGSSGQSSANRANERIARENREFQERMSSTAYQRATADLEKSGLNRILALGSPSSTPAGNIATMQNVKKPIQEGIQSGVSSALQATLLQQQIKNMETERLFKEAQTNAIAPADIIGGGLNAIVDSIKKLGPSKTAQKGVNKAIQAISQSLGMQPPKVQDTFLKTLREMDTPPNLTDPQLLEWGIQNIDAVKRYNDRKKTRGFE